jgi:hypothetical protein
MSQYSLSGIPSAGRPIAARPYPYGSIARGRNSLTRCLMPRAAWNTIATFYYGPCNPWAGDPSYVGPARYVPADGIHLVGNFAPVVTGYITYGTLPARGMWIPDQLGVNPNLSDRVYWGTALAPTHWVVWTERVVWEGDDYYRSSVSLLPVPPFVNCGGIESACYSGSGPCVLPAQDLVLDQLDLADGACGDCIFLRTILLVYNPSLGDWTGSMAACGGTFSYHLTMSTAGGFLRVTGPLFTDVLWTFAGCFSSPQSFTLSHGDGLACGFVTATTVVRTTL